MKSLHIAITVVALLLVNLSAGAWAQAGTPRLWDGDFWQFDLRQSGFLSSDSRYIAPE
jgi:hypothetical protein